MKIMVLTHDQSRRGRLVDFLTAKGYRVLVPSHRQDLWALLKEADPHVVVLDLYVAEPSGVDTLRKLRREGYRGGVVVLAGQGMRSLVAGATSLGVDGVIGGVLPTDGPLDVLQVESTIQACLHTVIARMAHERWDRAGRPVGRDKEFWFEAEREVRARGGFLTETEDEGKPQS